MDKIKIVPLFSRRDEFGSRRPIDILKATRPILIIDEPQSVLGTDKKNATRRGIREFNPLFTLLYSATHRKDDIYNMVFRLDAMDAYNKHLVKKVEVRSVHQIGSTATNGYLYLEGFVITKGAPQARISFDQKTASGTRQVTRVVGERFDFFEQSGGLQEYRDNCIVERIDAQEGTVRLLNGTVLREGNVVGDINEDVVRRHQIRETILTHLQRERELFPRHIKVLSLFFIDHVDNYRMYDKDEVLKGKYARMFEEEYHKAVQELMPSFTDGAYTRYLSDPRNATERVHDGYFSIDKKGKSVDTKAKEGDNEERGFDLIMKDKEKLLSLDCPVRFIFSHSALKEGWDNPNVFQICTLKDTSNEIKKRQEVGRGMRLCVNDRGERQDADVLGDAVFDTNVLTVVASESYDDFARKLQTEIAEACGERAQEFKVANSREKTCATFRQDNFDKREWQQLWKRINTRTYYNVCFDTSQLIEKAVAALDRWLNVTEIRIVVESGGLESIPDRESVEAGVAMSAAKVKTVHVTEPVGDTARYDLIGELVQSTGLTRRTIVNILQGVSPKTFLQFRLNPEEFLIKAGRIINDCKALSLIQHIRYERRDQTFDSNIFAEATLRGTLGKNAIESAKSLYDLVVVDSEGIEKSFAESLEAEDDVVVYSKLPGGFYINTPMGKYNPDWAVAFREGTVKHVYFVAETKGNDIDPSQLRGAEDAKIECARRHFEAISDGEVVYSVVKTYRDLYNAVMK